MKRKGHYAMAAFENKTVLDSVWKSLQQKSEPNRKQPINLLFK